VRISTAMRGLLVPGGFAGTVVTALAGGVIANQQSADVRLGGSLDRRCVISLGTSTTVQTAPSTQTVQKPLLPKLSQSSLSTSTLVSIICNFPGATLYDVLLPSDAPLSSQLLQAEINVMSRTTVNGQSLLTFQLTASPLDRTANWTGGAAAASLTPN